MNPLQERLQSFLNNEDISLRAFERQCNIKAGTASKMTENSYGTTFHKIAKAYPQLNVEWLKTGKGQMLNPQPQQPFIQGNHNKFNSQYGDVDGNIDIKGLCEKELQDVFWEIDKQRKFYEEQLKQKDAQIERLLALIETLTCANK